MNTGYGDFFGELCSGHIVASQPVPVRPGATHIIVSGWGGGGSGGAAGGAGSSGGSRSSIGPGSCQCEFKDYVMWVGAKKVCLNCGRDIAANDGSAPVAPALPKRMVCECGAQHTPNPNCHSHWCPAFKK